MDDLVSTSTLKESIYAFINLTEVNYNLVEKLNLLRKKLINKKNSMLNFWFNKEKKKHTISTFVLATTYLAGLASSWIVEC